ncbi:MAG TPA: rRNA maturation RNase YbeY [Sedimenticola thiotaurini]|uniref:Endoribonuclease YbeY n=1 Tax=Sedimenticola thiotaurini TaxID=1543721 RepID=A0A831RJV3_9GAMM|nr:rRNA maturation RNase YbeY [Sedimenticola thiotaurini]
MRPELAIQRISQAPGQPTDRQFQAWAEAALAGRREGAELTLRIVDEEESRALNRDYRHRDRPTNVLSFPFQAPPEVPSRLLGDLVICAPVVAREAREQGKTAAAHWAHMVVHGILHLLGHDHQQPAQAEEMEALESAILAGLGFGDPYRGGGEGDHERA